MNAEEVRATMDNRKTQTRRIVKLKPHKDFEACTDPDKFRLDCPIKGYARLHVPVRHWTNSQIPWEDCVADEVFCPYGKPGDRLWVRETFATGTGLAVAYKADAECGAWIGDGGGRRIWMHHGVIHESPAYQSRFENDQRHTTYSLAKYGGKWKPSIHMPRWTSRITLEITDVRVERLKDISVSDIQAEGLQQDARVQTNRDLKRDFQRLWESINGEGSWSANPWVWVVEFKRVKV